MITATPTTIFTLRNVANADLRAWLVEHVACPEALAWLGERDLRMALAECPDGSWITWYVRELNPDWWDQYAAAVKPLWDQYVAAEKALRDRYYAALKPLWDQYVAAVKPLWDQYVAAVKPLWDQYAAAEKALRDRYYAALKALFVVVD